MGFWSQLFGGGPELSDADAVKGWAQVVSVSQYHEGTYASCRMQLVIQAEGIPARAAEFEGLVHRRKWPQPGMQLPVLIDRTDPARFAVVWDLVPDGRDRAAATAEALAASLRGEAPPGGLGALGSIGSVQVVNLSGRGSADLSPEQRAKLQALGIDPGVLDTTPVVTPAADAEDETDDDISKLERLAALRDRGALTDEEFEVQKRAVLEGS